MASIGGSMAATGIGTEPIHNFLSTFLLPPDCARCAVLAATDTAGAKTLNSHARHAQYW
jgi:hypothetical protein